MMKGYHDNQKSFIIISTRNHAKETFTSLQIDKTFTRTTIHSNMKGSARNAFPQVPDRFTSNLFTKNDEMRDPLCIYYAQAIVELSIIVIIASQK